MAAIYAGLVCRLCGKKHDLFLANADLLDDTRKYLFRCPETNGKLLFRPTNSGEPIGRSRPANSIDTVLFD